MVIRVLDRNYFVTQILPSETGLLQYVCRDVTEDDGKLYRIVKMPVASVRPGLIRWLSSIYKRGHFRELVQYANENEELVVVADCGSRKARPLAEILESDHPSLKERLALGDRLVERLILSDVPEFFAHHALDEDHVRFTDAMECCFTFELEHLPLFYDTDPGEVQMRLKKVLERLFKDELKDEKIPEIKEVLDQIQQREFPDMMAVCQAYRSAAGVLSGKDEEKLEAKSLPYRIWDKIKSFVRLLKKLFFLVVFFIAAAYLVLSVKNFLAPTEQMDVYKSIGTMEIVSGTASAEEETGAGSVPGEETGGAAEKNKTEGKK